jgi:hypothetical protein
METSIIQILEELSSYKKKYNRSSTSPITDIANENELSSYFYNMVWPPSDTVLSNRYKEYFRPSILIWLTRKYKIKTLLDADVGGGNRLIATILNHQKYIGICSYLPMIKNLEYIADNFEYNDLEIIKGTFDKVFIGNYAFDMIFLPFEDDVEPIKVYNWIMKAWNNLNINGILCVYSLNFTSEFKLMITTIMKIFTGIDITLSGKCIKLYSVDEQICLWRKIKEEQFPLHPHITIDKNIYQTNGVPLIRRGIATYLRCLPRDLHYVANSYTVDTLALYLAMDVPKEKKLTVYIDSNHNYLIGDIKRLGKENVEIVIYGENSTEKYELLYNDLPDSQYLLKPGLDSPVFESCIVRELKTDLPQNNNGLIEPERIWLETDYIVLIRALLYTFNKTVLLISHNNIGKNMKEMLSAESRGRVIFHRKKGKQTLSNMMEINGYEEDKLFI